MKSTVWACDRCGTTVDAPYELLALCDEEHPPGAFVLRSRPHDPPGWVEFIDDEPATDVCPDCLTDGERIDQLLHEVEREIPF